MASYTYSMTTTQSFQISQINAEKANGLYRPARRTATVTADQIEATRAEWMRECGARPTWSSDWITVSEI
jgi:hypothetical protein